MAKKAGSTGQSANNPFDMSAMTALFDPSKMMEEFNK